MGQWRTHRSESQDVTPAKAGVHVEEELDSRFRGNDVAFNRARRFLAGEESPHLPFPSTSARDCTGASRNLP